MNTNPTTNAKDFGHHRRETAWRDWGLSTRAATALATAGCETINDISRLGRNYFANHRNVGAHTLAELDNLNAWPRPRRTAVDAIAAAFQMTMSADEAREAALDALHALRRSGFAIIAGSAPGGSR
jgi:hypothetical protein